MTTIPQRYRRRDGRMDRQLGLAVPRYAMLRAVKLVGPYARGPAFSSVSWIHCQHYPIIFPFISLAPHNTSPSCRDVTIDCPSETILLLVAGYALRVAFLLLPDVDVFIARTDGRTDTTYQPDTSQRDSTQLKAGKWKCQLV